MAMLAPPAMTFRRVISDALEAEVAAGGTLRPLIDVALADPRMDMQLRRQGGTSWVTLYCGLTSVLDIVEAGGRIRFTAAQKHRDTAKFDPAWRSRTTSAELPTAVPGLAGYLERILAAGAVNSRYTRSEGQVQTTISRSPSSEFGMFQREALPAFVNSSERDGLVDPLWDKAWTAMEASTFRPDWWPGVRDGKKPPRKGLETDLVGIDAAGRFLVVEVKPSEEIKGMAWAPGQVRLYAEVFAAWSSTTASASADINAMAEQRARLGLPVTKHRLASGSPIRVAPVIAAGPTAVRSLVLDRMRKVHTQLATAPMEFAELIDPVELWEFDESGARTKVTLL